MSDITADETNALIKWDLKMNLETMYKKISKEGSSVFGFLMVYTYLDTYESISIQEQRNYMKFWLNLPDKTFWLKNPNKTYTTEKLRARNYTKTQFSIARDNLLSYASILITVLESQQLKSLIPVQYHKTLDNILKQVKYGEQCLTTMRMTTSATKSEYIALDQFTTTANEVVALFDIDKMTIQGVAQLTEFQVPILLQHGAIRKHAADIKAVVAQQPDMTYSQLLDHIKLVIDCEGLFNLVKAHMDNMNLEHVTAARQKRIQEHNRQVSSQ